MRPVCRMLQHVEQAIRSAIKTSVASSWHFISTYFKSSFNFTYALHQGTKIKISHIQHYRIKWVPLVTYCGSLSLCTLRILLILFLPPWRCVPTRALPSSLLKFLDHTQRRTAVDRTPLDERSVRCRDFYLTQHSRQTSVSPAGERPHTHALDQAATETGVFHLGVINCGK